MRAQAVRRLPAAEAPDGNAPPGPDPGAPASEPGAYLTDLAPIPAVAMKVLHLAENPSTTVSEMAAVISADQAIAFKVVQLANSAYYGLSRRIDTIHQAVSLLGLLTIRSLVLLHSIPAGLARGGGARDEEKSLWEHALGVAVASRLLARRLRGIDPESAFLAGLLHDVGKSVLLLKEPAVMTRVLRNREFFSTAPGETAAFGFDHQELGSRVLEYWTFPELFCAVAHRHHSIDQGSDFAMESVLVATADAMTHFLGAGWPVEPRAWPAALKFGGRLELDEPALQEVAARTRQEIDAFSMALF